MTLADLQAFRAKLFESRMSGIRTVMDSNGESITYKGDSEMAAAIAACDREIAALSGRPPHTIRFKTSKGL